MTKDLENNQVKPKIGGRAKGTPNKVTATVKDNILAVFNRLKGTEGMAQWARENQTEFYKLYGRLIPTETKLTGDPEQPIAINTRPQLTKEEWLALHGLGTTAGRSE